MVFGTGFTSTVGDEFARPTGTGSSMLRAPHRKE
jgi:hypothetical protein